MTTVDRAGFQASRYLHLLHRHGEAIAFNSHTLAMYELEPVEDGYLRRLATGGEVVAPDSVDLTALAGAGLIVRGEEPPLQAVQRLAEIRQAARRGRRGHFGTLRLAVTERCNMACGYCFQQRLFPDAQPVMSTETLRSTLGWYIEQGRGHALTVQYFGGEPMLEWDSIVLGHSIMAEALADGMITGLRETMTTNGTVLTEARASWLVEAGFDLTVSFDGPPEVNDAERRFRGGRGTYEAAARGLRHWTAAGGRSSILMTATTGNVVHLPRFVRWFVEESGLAPKTVGVNSPQPTPSGWETGGRELADAIWEIWRYCTGRGVRFHGPGTFIPFHLRSLAPQADGCVDAADGEGDPAWPMYVSADGRRSLCLVHHRDHRVEMPADEDPTRFGHAWHTGTDPVHECDTCIASQTCGGPCSLERVLWGGRLNEDRCGFMRRMTTLVLTASPSTVDGDLAGRR